MSIKELKEHTFSSVPLSREMARMVIPLKNRLILTIGGKTFHLEDGQIALVAAGEYYSIEKEAHLMQIGFIAEPSLCQGAYSLSGRHQIILDLLVDCQEDDPKILPLCEYLLLCCQKENALQPQAISKDLPLFEQADAYLRERIEKNVSVDELADAIGISISHLKRIFARYAGKGAHDYFNDLKIEYAKELLAAGHSVTQTAALTGFANQAYFSAAFKRITGQSPKEFAGKKQATPSPTRPRTAKPKAKPIESKRDLPSYLL